MCIHVSERATENGKILSDQLKFSNFIIQFRMILTFWIKKQTINNFAATSWTAMPYVSLSTFSALFTSCGSSRTEVIFVEETWPPIGHASRNSPGSVPDRYLGTRMTTVPYQIDEEAAPLPQQPRGRQALSAERSTNGVVAGLSTPAWLPPCRSPLFDFSTVRNHLNDRNAVGGRSAGGCERLVL